MTISARPHTEVTNTAAIAAQNDLDGYHDFAVVDARGAKILWEVGLYKADGDFHHGAVNPDNLATIMRVVTIMMASDRWGVGSNFASEAHSESPLTLQKGKPE